MTAVNKIDSNITGLAYAEEESLGTLPGSPTWYQLQPNSYNDFGGELTTVAPNPINDSRQRLKGVTVDLDASGGFNHDLDFFNLKDLMQGVMFADIRAKGEETVTAVDVDTSNPDEYEVASTTGFLVGHLIQGFGFTEALNNAVNEVTAIVTDTSVEVADGQLVAEAAPPSNAIIKVIGVVGAAGDLDVDVSGTFPAIDSAVLDFTTLGLVEGQWVYIGGDAANTSFSNSVNNGFKRIRSIAANTLTFDKSVSDMVVEASTTETVHIYFGDVLKNEQSGSIVRRSYQLERTLGAPDDALPAQIQSEVLTGSVPNEISINLPTANLVNYDFSFVSIDNEQRTGATGPKQSSVQSPRSAEVFNTTNDFARIKMHVVSTTDEAPDSLFAFVTEAALTINNNVSPNKAIGTLGAFDVTAGTFQVSGTITAYFADVAAVTAVRNNSDVTLDMAMVKDNQGIVLDLPLISLGDGRLNVEQDQPITLPLTLDAATAESIDSAMDYTVMFTYFWYLPTAAG